MQPWSLRHKAGRFPLMIALAIVGLALPPLPTHGASVRAGRASARQAPQLQHAAGPLATIQQRPSRPPQPRHDLGALPNPADLEPTEEEQAPAQEGEEAERGESPVDSSVSNELLARLEGVAGRRPSERAARSLAAEGLNRPDASPHAVNAGRLRLRSRRTLDAAPRDLPALLCCFTC